MVPVLLIAGRGCCGARAPAGSAAGHVGLGPRAHRRSAKPEIDPAARVAKLSALVEQRAQSVRAAQARRDDLAARLGRGHDRRRPRRQARTDRFGALAARPQPPTPAPRPAWPASPRPRTATGRRVTPLTQLLSSRSAADYSYRHEIVQRVGDAAAPDRHDRQARPGDGEGHRRRGPRPSATGSPARRLADQRPPGPRRGRRRRDRGARPGPVLAGPLAGDRRRGRRLPILGPTLLERGRAVHLVHGHAPPRPDHGPDRGADPGLRGGGDGGRGTGRHRVRAVDARDRRVLVPGRRAGARHRQQLRRHGRVRQLPRRQRVPGRAHRRPGPAAAAARCTPTPPSPTRRSTRRR